MYLIYFCIRNYPIHNCTIMQLCFVQQRRILQLQIVGNCRLLYLTLISKELKEIFELI